ncbi:hypothetical protein PTKU46_87840 [Paraburkholderia terrae]
MFPIPQRYNHFLSSDDPKRNQCAVASAISSAPFYRENTFVAHWISAYMVSWMAMLPQALAAAPWIRRVVGLLTAPTPTGRASPEK